MSSKLSSSKPGPNFKKIKQHLNFYNFMKNSLRKKLILLTFTNNICQKKETIHCLKIINFTKIMLVKNPYRKINTNVKVKQKIL